MRNKFANFPLFSQLSAPIKNGISKKSFFFKISRVYFFSYGHEKPCQISCSNSSSIRAQKLEAEMSRLYRESARININSSRLFERSEFLIDTSQKKSLRVCTCARVHACSNNLGFSVWYYVPHTYLDVSVDTYVPGLHPRPRKKNRRPTTGSGIDACTARQQ